MALIDKCRDMLVNQIYPLLEVFLKFLFLFPQNGLICEKNISKRNIDLFGE